VCKRALIAALAAALTIAPSAAAQEAGAEIIRFDPIIIPMTGEQFTFPCGVPDVLGTFTSGTLEITASQVTTPQGTTIGTGKAVWRDVVAVTEDGTVYRIIALSSSASVQHENVEFLDQRYAIADHWLIIGPTGQEYVGVVIFHGTLLPDGLPSIEFVRATSDAECG
jgi:hypothetical protein